APNLFGNYYDAFLGDLPWMGALNFGRDPFFYSIYIGPLVLLLAAVGLRRGWRRNGIWLAVAVAFPIAALGGYPPGYPLLRELMPPLLYFRFPVKYIVFADFAVIVLATDGLSQLGGHPSEDGGYLAPVLASVGLVGVCVTLTLIARPETLHAVAQSLAVA